MRQIAMRTLAVIATLVAILQAVVGAVPALATPAQPATATPRFVAVQTIAHRLLRQQHHAAQVDHELVTKSWANIRSAPTTVGNRPIGHFGWHARFTALHQTIYGQHPYGPGSSNHWLKIASGTYRGDFVWAIGVVDPRGPRAPPTVAQVRSHRHRLAHFHPAPRRYHRSYGSYYRSGGTLGCYGLEALWRSAGGSSWAAETAAAIAMAESSGRQYATGPAGERGYWQIHPDHGPILSTYNPYGNARAAVIISVNGTNWSAWTTYRTGAYRGRCLPFVPAHPRRSHRCPPAS